jgi:hypothetical protein
MRVLYILLQLVLVTAYAAVLAKALKASRGLNLLLGWLVGLGFFLLVPLSIIVLNGGFRLPLKFDVGQAWGRVDLSTTEFLLPYLIVWTSLLASCIALYFFLPYSARGVGKENKISLRALERAIWVTIVISLLDWMTLIHLVGGLDVFLVSHWYHRSEDLVSKYGDSFVLLEHLSLVNQLIFTSAAALYTSLGLRSRDTRWKFIAIILLFFLLEIVMSGNRIFFACYLLAFLSACWIHDRRKLFFGMVALSPIIILIFSLWASVRHDLTDISDSLDTALQEESGSPLAASVVNVTMDATEGIDTLLLLHVPNDFGNRVPYLYGVSYSRAITSPIPRFLFPQKPINFTEYLAQVYLPGEETSLNATAVGEMYANFGPLTSVFFPLLSLGIAFLSKRASEEELRHGLLPTLLFVLAIWAARSTLEDSCVMLALAYVIILLFRLEKGLTVSPLNNRVSVAASSGLGRKSLNPVPRAY